MRPFLTLALLCMTHLVLAQETPVVESGGYWLSVETYAVHTQGELAGMSTYRLYLNTASANDFLSYCGGDENRPLIMTSSSGSWYNNSFNASWNTSGINPNLFFFYPELAYDSYLTIGLSESSLTLPLTPSGVSGEVVRHGNLSMDQVRTSSSMTTLAVLGLGYSMKIQAGRDYAGDDLKVLIAQFTTAGTISDSFKFRFSKMGH